MLAHHPVVGCCCSAVDVVHLHVALVVVVVVPLVLDDERCAGLKLVDGDGRARCQCCC